MKRSTQVIVAGVALVAIGIGAFVYWYQREIVIADVRAAKWQQLSASVETIKRGEFPQSWLAGAYISNQVFSSLLDAEQGTRVEVAGVKDYEDLVLTIDSARLIAHTEGPEIALEISAASPKNKLAVRLRTSGILLYRGVSASSTADAVKADFGLVLTELKPQLSWSGLSFGVPVALRELVVTGVMKTFSESLVVTVPVSSKLELSFGGLREEVVPIKETGGSIKLQWGGELTKLSRPIAYSVPLYTEAGVWLLATDAAALPPKASGPEHPTENDLDALRNTLAKLLPEAAKPKGDLAVWLNSRFVLDIIKDVAALPAERRTIVVRSIEASGDLFEKRWRDDVLGKGGVKLYPVNNNFLAITATIAPPTATWVPQQGINLALPATVEAAANVHWHIDPLVGRGFGHDLGLSGKAAQTLSARVGLQIVKLPKAELAVFAPALECVNVPIQIAASGDIKVSAKTGFLVFDKPTTPSIFMDPLPRRVSLAAKDPPKEGTPESKPAKPGEIQVKVSWKLPEIDVTLTPVTVQITELGYYVEAKAAVAPASKATEAEIKAQRDAIADELKTYWESTVQQTCPKQDDLRVTVAGIEIGPNGLGVQAIKAFEQGAREVDKAVRQAGKSVGEHVKRIFTEVKKFFSKFGR